MDIITLDMECFYSSEYSLSKMTTESYLRDPRFEEILWGVKVNDGTSFWLLPERAAQFFSQEVDWANTAVLHHHAHFDAARLAWGHGVHPSLVLDSLSMARIIDGPKAKNGLEFLALRHGLGMKGDAIKWAIGKHLADFSARELALYGNYCCNDVDLTYSLAQLFLPQLPQSEIDLISLTVKMFTEPVLVGDSERLRSAVVAERERKKALLTQLGYICGRCHGDGHEQPLPGVPVVPCKDCKGLGVDRAPFSSSDKFADILRSHGVEPKTKTSPTTGEQIYALARTDSAMQELLEDEDELVRTLAEARVSVKSTIVETRAERFQHCAERGPMPVYLSYGAAHTFRWGGGDSMNWQNLSGHNATRPEMSVIKASVGAPPGFKCIRRDSSQGEARIVAFNADQADLVGAFARGEDVYSSHASTIYGRMVNRRDVVEDFIPGQLGKVSILGMGYGMGWYKAAMELLKGMLGAPPIRFTKADMEMLHVDPSRFLNNPKKVAAVNEMPSRLELSDRFYHCIVAEALVQRYRTRYPKIPQYWNLMEEIIDAMIHGIEMTFGANGCMRTAKDKIWMPNGLSLNYKDIQRSNGEASYFDGRGRTRIHGPLLTENTTQCLHRIIVSEQMLEIAEVLKVGLMTHDDVTTVVPDEAAPLALELMGRAMVKVPAWAKGLPMASEGKIGQCLLDVK